MRVEALSVALEREHREIDERLERFIERPSSVGAATQLTAATQALRRHIYLEEELLFPALYAGAEARLVSGMLAALREHAVIWRLLDALDGELGSGDDMRAASSLCHRAVVALQHHNRNEERVIYAGATHGLSPVAAENLTAFLEVGRRPAGWVCSKVRA